MINSVPSLGADFRDQVLAKDVAARTSPGDVVRMGVIGYGYWGPNIVRNLSALDNCELVAVCDKSPAAEAVFSK